MRADVSLYVFNCSETGKKQKEKVNEKQKVKEKHGGTRGSTRAKLIKVYNFKER